MNNPSPIKRIILKIKNLIGKIKNRFDLKRQLKLIQENYEKLNNDKLNLKANLLICQTQVDELRNQLIEKNIEFVAMDKILTKKCDELVNLKIKKTVEKIESELIKK